MSIMRRILCIIMCWVGLTEASLSAQELGHPHIINYTFRDYQASSTNFTAIQDGRGLLYVGNMRGLLEFDGASWTLIPVSNQTPVRSLARDSLGRIYVGASGEFGFLAPDSAGHAAYHSLWDVAQINPTANLSSEVVEVIGAEEGAYFHFEERGDQLFYWDGMDLRQWSLPRPFHQAHLHYIGGKLWASLPGEGLFVWQERAFRPVEQHPQFAQYEWRLLSPWQNGQWIGFDGISNELWVIDRDFASPPRKFNLERGRYIQQGILTHMLVLADGQLMVATRRNGAYLYDRQGKLIRRLSSEMGLQDNLVIGGTQDSYGNLWLCLSKGVSQIEISSPISKLGETSGLKGLVFAAMRHQGSLYATTSLGAFVLKGQQFVAIPGLNEETYRLDQAFLTRKGGKARSQLIAQTENRLYTIEGQQAKPLLAAANCRTYAVGKAWPNYLFMNDLKQQFLILKHNGRSWEQIGAVGALSGKYDLMVPGTDQDLWLLEQYGDGSVRRIRLGEKPEAGQVGIRVFGERDSLPPVQNIFSFHQQLLFSTDKGLYIFEADKGQFSRFTLASLPQEGILNLSEDSLGNVWVVRKRENRTLIEILQKQVDGRYERDTTSLSVLGEIELWGELYAEPSGNTWIIAQDGLYCYHPQYQQQISAMWSPLIRSVGVGEDSIIFNGMRPLQADSIRMAGAFGLGEQGPVLSYQHNSISFKFVVPSFIQPEDNQYAYRLMGQNEDWSTWDNGRKKDYTHLPPGTYEFQVKARDRFHQESGIVRFPFEIQPPWYRTIWAFLSYGLLAILLVYGTVKLNTQRLYLQNEHLERLVYERTNEIWDQHKEIVKKTVALKRQKEEIASQHSLLEEKNGELEETLQKLKKAQTQLIESEKMASLGQLTAGIAHEINNPINYVKGNINPLKRDFDDIKGLFESIQELNLPAAQAGVKRQIESLIEEADAPFLFDEMALLLKGIEDGATRTKEIVEGLRIFSRTDREQFKYVNVHDGLESTLTLLNNKTKGRIEIVKEYEEMEMIECLPGKLNQVFMNILTNGIQAIEEKHAQNKEIHATDQEEGPVGILYIKTEKVMRALPGYEECVQISLKDSGIGIPEHIRSKIFDPFFTTKDVGEGTGLGLSITFGIIEQHNGRIEVHSKPGVGTTFLITLPFRQE